MANISLDRITLDFPIYGTNTRSLKRQLLRITTGGAIRQADNEIITVRALDDFSVTFNSGDTVGLIGHNGAGKSTLLKVLAGIYEPTIGNVHVEGKVAALLGLSVGMDPESTGYENITLTGIFRGLTHKEIHAKATEIAEFTELGDYLYMPMRTYSDGMRLRLAFSLATSLSAEILLLDEVVNAGDHSFMEKAQKRLEALVKRSELVIFSSHALEAVQKFCNKILWIEAGRLVFYGDTEEGIKRYLQHQHK